MQIAIVRIAISQPIVLFLIICNAIKQNESKVEKYDFWFFSIFY